MKRMTMWALLLLLTPALMIGCGKDKAEEPANAVEAAAAEVKEAGHDVAEAVDEASGDAAEMVESTVEDIEALIAEKEGELKALTDKLTGMSPSDLVGKAGAEMKEKQEALMNELSELREKLKAAM